MRTWYIGVDPGAPVFLCLINEKGNWVAHLGEDKTSVKIGTKTENSPELVAMVMRKWRDEAKRKDVDIALCVEHVVARPHQDIVSVAKLVGSMWMIEGIAAGLNIRNTRVTPQTWQRHFKVDKEPESSRALALKLWPDRAFRLQYKKDHNFAEAALLGRYLWEKESDR